MFKVQSLHINIIIAFSNFQFSLSQSYFCCTYFDDGRWFHVCKYCYSHVKFLRKVDSFQQHNNNTFTFSISKENYLYCNSVLVLYSNIDLENGLLYIYDSNTVNVSLFILPQVFV